MSAEVGGSVVLQSGYQREDVGNVDWSFKDELIAELTKTGDDVGLKTQFEGRLELIPGNVSLKVNRLTKEDSGQFHCLITGKDGKQLATKSFKLQVYGKIIISVSLSLMPNVIWQFQRPAQNNSDSTDF